MNGQRYQNTAANANPLLEEREYTKYLHSLYQFVQSPAFSSYGYGASMFVGAVMMAGGGLYYATGGSFWGGFLLALLGSPFFGGGFFGWRTFNNQLEKFEPVTNLTTIEYEPTSTEEQDRVRYSGRAGTDYMVKKRKDVDLRFGNDETFTFTGRNMDKILHWLKEPGTTERTSIRKQGSAVGHGFNELPDPITSEAYTNATAALLENDLLDSKSNKYFWTNKGMEWLESAGT